MAGQRSIISGEKKTLHDELVHSTSKLIEFENIPVRGEITASFLLP